jgi:hypothetical protein
MPRHYHQVGLLEPVDVDRATGDRGYSTDEIRTVMSTTDIHRRNELINAHFMRLESQFPHTKRAVESLS